MSATPTKVCKRGRKPKIDIQKNSSCRFCGVNFTSGGGRASFENLFSPSGREESVGLILAECCGSIGFPLTRDQTLSDRVCRSCGRKIRNAAELYSFIEQAVCSTRVADEDLNSKDSEDRCKRQLPTTVTPERSKTKKVLIGADGKRNQKSTGKVNSKKALFSESLATSNSSDLEEVISDINTFSQTSEEVTPTTTKPGQDADFLANYCNIDDISGKPSVQLKVLILYPGGEVTVRKSFDDATKSLITNLALKNWKTAANHAFRHEELKEHTMEAVRIAVSSEFKALSTSDTILKGRKPEEIAAFSNKVFLHEVSVFCPLWHACLKGACGITKAKSQSEKMTKSTNVMALSTASLARFRNSQLSAYAYRLSTILFHSGAKYNDIIRLNRLGLCMSPQSAVNFQRQMGENFDAKVLLWKKSVEETATALNLLNAVQCDQVPVIEEDDMDLTVSIDFEEATLRNYAAYDLNAFNFCRNLLEIIRKRMQEDAVNSDVLKEAIAELRNQRIPSYKIVGDNVDHMIHARIQSKVQTNQSVHWTHQYAVLDRVKSNVLVSQKAKKKIRDIELVEILPVQDVQQRLKNRWAVLVSRTVCKFLQAFKHLENVAVHHIPHPLSDEMSQKSTSCCLGLQFKNPNIQAEMAQLIMDNQDKYVPCQTNSEGEKKILHPVPLHGDQLFEERARNAQWTFQDGITKYERLEGIYPEAADWHAKVNLYELENAMFVKHSSSAEVGTSRSSMNRTGKTNAAKDVHNHYNEYKEFHQCEVEAHICASFMQMLGMKKVDDPPECAIPSANVEKSERRKWLTDICLEYVDTYIGNSDEVTVLVEQIRELHKAQEQPFCCRQPHCSKTYVYHSGRVKHEIDAHSLNMDPGPEERDKFGYFKCRAKCGYVFSTKATRNRHEREFHPDCSEHNAEPEKEDDKNPAQDYIYNYHRGKLAFGLILFEFNDAIKEGDGNRIFDIYKMALLFYKAGGHNKYAYVVLLYLVKVIAILSESEARQLKWNRGFNKHGGKGKNIPLDQELEHRNKTVKTVWRGLGANLTESNAQRMASGLELLDMLLKSIDDDCKLAANIKQRTKGDPEDAVMQIISDLMNKEAFIFKGGRDGHPSFPKFPANLLHNIDYRDLHKWLSDLLKKWESIYERDI